MDHRPVPVGENRLAEFNNERDSIVEEVLQRVVDDRVLRAADRVEDSLEYVLNEVAFSEIRRLEKGGPKKSLARWNKLAHRLGHMSEADKRKELCSICRFHAEDIAGNFNPRVYRFATDVLPPALNFLLKPVSGFRAGLRALGSMAEQIRIEGPLDQIRHLCRRGTLIVTPTHSSNLDSILLGFGLMRSGLPPVTYGAGKNLFTNPFMSYFMENLGAYRVDRRLRFSLYKEVLKEYSTVLIERGYHSLFFPGGTRSRGNHVEQKLKLGLLGTAITALVNRQRRGDTRNIYILPVTINYRLVLEAETLIEDFLAETGKSRYIIEDDEFSRLGKVVEFGRKIFAHEGAAILRFGTPLDCFGNTVDGEGESFDRAGHRVEPATYLQGNDGYVQNDDQRDSVYTRMLGSSLADAFHSNTVFLGTAVVARAAMEVAKRRTGIRDILHLLRLSESALALPAQELYLAVDELVEAIDAQPEKGALDASLRGLNGQAIVEQTLRYLGSYHSKPTIYLQGDHVHIGSMKLLYYYQNRTSHLSFAATARRVP